MLDTAARDLDQPSLRKLAPAVYSGSRVYRAVVPVQIFDDLWRDEFGASEPHRVHRENLLMVSACVALINLRLPSRSTLASGMLVYHVVPMKGFSRL